MQVKLKENIIGQYRGVLTQLADAMDQHNRLAKEFAAMGLTLVDADFKVGSPNEGITAVEFTAAYAALVAIEGLLSANSNLHYGNIFKVRS